MIENKPELPAELARMKEGMGLPPSAILLRPKVAAVALCVSTRSFWRLVARGELPVVKVGKLTRVTLAAVQAFIASHTVGGMMQ